MTESANFAIPSPEGSDPADAPSGFEAQADRIDEILSKGIRSSANRYIGDEQSTASASYTYLGTQDRVTIDVNNDADLIAVMYRAYIADLAQAGRAAIFLNSTRASEECDLTIGTAYLMTTAAAPRTLVQASALTPVPSFGLALFWVAAGSYEVGVKFKAPGGGPGPTDVHISDRRLNVFALGFGLP